MKNLACIVRRQLKSKDHFNIETITVNSSNTCYICKKDDKEGDDCLSDNFEDNQSDGQNNCDDILNNSIVCVWTAFRNFITSSGSQKKLPAKLSDYLKKEKFGFIFDSLQKKFQLTSASLKSILVRVSRGFFFFFKLCQMKKINYNFQHSTIKNQYQIIKRFNEVTGDLESYRIEPATKQGN